MTKKKLFLKGFNKDIGKYSFSSRVCSLWNSLPYHVIHAKDLKKFEIALDQHWSNQEIMYDDFKADIDLQHN